MTERIAPINSALIQDEVLGELALVLNSGKSAGPNFLNCIGSVVEACVLHEDIFVLPAREFEAKGSKGLTTLIEESDLTTSLLREGVFRSFPQSDRLNKYLEASGAEYDTIDFLTDLRWTGGSMLPSNSDQEEVLWWFEDFILKQAPELFEAEFCTDRTADGVDVPISAAGLDVVSKGVPVAQLVRLEGWNRQIRALQKMARLIGLSLYVVPSGTVHQLGSLSAVNLKARDAYERIKSELNSLVDDRVGHAEFMSSAVPPLTSIAINKCKGDSSALVDTLLGMRHEYRGLRRYLTDFESAWMSAPNRNERLKLQSSFDAAVKALVERDKRPHDRLFYKIWDVVKVPSRALQALGDKLVARGREEAVVGQVRGLRAFWRAALDAPLQGQVDLCSSLVSKVAPERVWQASTQLATSARDSIVNKTWKGA